MGRAISNNGSIPIIAYRLRKRFVRHGKRLADGTGQGG